MTTTAHRSSAGTKPVIQTAALLVGAVFLLVGILGFVPGITAQYDQLAFAGHGSEAMLLGLFQVSVLHNVVHLLFGIAGLALARSASGARSFLLFGGIIYLVLWVYGILFDQSSALNFVPLNAADNWLHLLLGVAMVALAFILGPKSKTRA